MVDVLAAPWLPAASETIDASGSACSFSVKLGALRATRKGNKMSDKSRDRRPWLLELGTPQRGEMPMVDGAAYDEGRQMTVLREPNIPVIDAGMSVPTKKADREVGEDQKRW
jgi:hypothetical protein